MMSIEQSKNQVKPSVLAEFSFGVSDVNPNSEPNRKGKYICWVTVPIGCVGSQLGRRSSVSRSESNCSLWFSIRRHVFEKLAQLLDVVKEITNTNAQVNYDSGVGVDNPVCGGCPVRRTK